MPELPALFVLVIASWPKFSSSSSADWNRSPRGGSCNSRYNRSAKGRASAATKTQVEGRGAIAVAAQVTNENKLKVTAIEIRPANNR
jgi:hypothetical protein